MSEQYRQLLRPYADIVDPKDFASFTEYVVALRAYCLAQRYAQDIISARQVER